MSASWKPKSDSNLSKLFPMLNPLTYRSYSLSLLNKRSVWSFERCYENKMILTQPRRGEADRKVKCIRVDDMLAESARYQSRHNSARRTFFASPKPLSGAKGKGNFVPTLNNITPYIVGG